MSDKDIHISICICTYRRTELLKRLLKELVRQQTKGQFSYSIVVADNDEHPSARQLVQEFTNTTHIDITYCFEPRKSISFARNKALEHAKGDFIAFIDDDEFPAENWLLNLYNACVKYDVAGILGPVRPHYNQNPPDWILKGKFHERPEHQTGFVIPWQETRTGNVLFRRRIIEGITPIFRPEYGTGGGDIDFFRRMIEVGHKFIWCNEAAVYETVPPSRWKRSFMLKRALLRGRNNMRHPTGRLIAVAKSMIAVPAYALALPFLQLAGHHYFMKFLIKLCDHAGRLLTLVGLNPVKEREM
jgi:glycosyltransferase involved in cell wall biosynthesis